MMSQAPIMFDRATGRLGGASFAERWAARAMQAGAKATAPFAHLGYSLGCRILAAILPRRDIVVRMNDDALFAFPFGDGYWSVLLDRRHTYESEIDAFLRSVADVDFTFLDCGANFGLWSVLVTSAPYGRHRALAIEASSANAAKLARNASLNGNRFGIRREAIGRASGGEAWLGGRKHEAFSITAERAGEPGERVSITALDSLIEGGIIAPDGRYVLKLDVEGMEIDALAGAPRLLAAETVVICEEHGSDRDHKVTRYALGELAARVFVFDPAVRRFTPVLDTIKVNRKVGYNVFITTSTLWETRLQTLSARSISD
jgi:FkbM family methyltransferase